MTEKPQKRLGELLRELDLLTDEELQQALDVQRATGERLGETLIRLHFVEAQELAQALASQQSFEGIDPLSVTPSAAALALLEPALAFELGCLPLEVHADELIAAMADPGDAERRRRLEAACGKKVRALIAPQTALYRALKRHYESPIPPDRGRAIRGYLDEMRRLVKRIERLLDEE